MMIQIVNLSSREIIKLIFQVGVNTHKANKIVKHALENKLMKEFKNIKI